MEKNQEIKIEKMIVKEDLNKRENVFVEKVKRMKMENVLIKKIKIKMEIKDAKVDLVLRENAFVEKANKVLMVVV